jgi:hypothetical protein
MPNFSRNTCCTSRTTSSLVRCDTTCTVAVVLPTLNCHTCTSCTFVTPSIAMSAAVTSAGCTSSGADSIRMTLDWRMTDTAPRVINTAITMEMTGSIHSQCVTERMIAPMITPPLDKRSVITCRYALRVVTCSDRCKYNALIAFATKPTIAMASIDSAWTCVSLPASRLTDSITLYMQMPIIVRMQS